MCLSRKRKSQSRKCDQGERVPSKDEILHVKSLTNIIYFMVSALPYSRARKILISIFY